MDFDRYVGFYHTGRDEAKSIPSSEVLYEETQGGGKCRNLRKIE